MGDVGGYLIYANPRTGSWLLCHGLEQAGIAGTPAEYFWRGDMPFWSERWGVTDFRDYVAAYHGTATPNGVAGSKIMWGYFFDFLDRARSVPEWAPLDHAELMHAVFGDLDHLWIRRRDKVRQGISWWRAERTGQCAVHRGETPERPPETLDLAEVKNLVQVAESHERAWASYFDQYGITPWTVDYEDLITDLDSHVADALNHLGLELPEGFTIRPRLERQADATTERWIDEYLAAEASGQLDDIKPMAQAAIEGRVRTLDDE